MGGAVRAVGQRLPSVGARDPRLTSSNKMDFRLTRMWAAYKKADPPPQRVKPIPICVLRHIITIPTAGGTSAILSNAHMIVIAFFYLLRSGDYTSTASDTTPFTTADVQLFMGATRLDLASTPAAVILRTTLATLEFTTQKNGVRGEVIGLGRSGIPLLYPVITIASRIIHLRQHGAPAATLLSHCIPS